MKLLTYPVKFTLTKEKLELLNQWLHPLVYVAFENAVMEAEEAGAEILVLEAALLYESGGG